MEPGDGGEGGVEQFIARLNGQVNNYILNSGRGGGL